MVSGGGDCGGQGVVANSPRQTVRAAASLLRLVASDKRTGPQDLILVSVPDLHQRDAQTHIDQIGQQTHQCFPVLIVSPAAA